MANGLVIRWGWESFWGGVVGGLLGEGIEVSGLFPHACPVHLFHLAASDLHPFIISLDNLVSNWFHEICEPF